MRRKGLANDDCLRQVVKKDPGALLRGRRM